VNESTEVTLATARGPFAVRVELFDGPIDLLLHLVKREELPIEKISLAQVASQYFECVRHLTGMDFEIVGEYLVIAATLLALKAAYLLNEPTADIEIKEIEESGDDPHEELIARLKEAEVYKRTAYELSTRDLLGVDVFEPPVCKREPSSLAPLKHHDPFILGQAFRRLLERARARKLPFSLMVNHVSITERMMQIVARLEQSEQGVEFTTLLDDSADVGSLIVSFLAILELAKRSVVVINQEAAFGEIVLHRAGVGLGGVYESVEEDRVAVEVQVPSYAAN
jgi:segregation and condensation protein A